MPTSCNYVVMYFDELDNFVCKIILIGFYNWTGKYGDIERFENCKEEIWVLSSFNFGDKIF